MTKFQYSRYIVNVSNVNNDSFHYSFYIHPLLFSHIIGSTPYIITFEQSN